MKECWAACYGAAKVNGSTVKLGDGLFQGRAVETVEIAKDDEERLAQVSRAELQQSCAEGGSIQASSCLADSASPEAARLNHAGGKSTRRNGVGESDGGA